MDGHSGGCFPRWSCPELFRGVLLMLLWFCRGWVTVMEILAKCGMISRTCDDAAKWLSSRVFFAKSIGSMFLVFESRPPTKLSPHLHVSLYTCLPSQTHEPPPGVGA